MVKRVSALSIGREVNGTFSVFGSSWRFAPVPISLPDVSILIHRDHQPPVGKPGFEMETGSA